MPFLHQNSTSKQLPGASISSISVSKLILEMTYMTYSKCQDLFQSDLRSICLVMNKVYNAED